jgi:hypothetical protein
MCLLSYVLKILCMWKNRECKRYAPWDPFLVTQEHLLWYLLLHLLIPIFMREEYNLSKNQTPSSSFYFWEGRERRRSFCIQWLLEWQWREGNRTLFLFWLCSWATSCRENISLQEIKKDVSRGILSYDIVMCNISLILRFSRLYFFFELHLSRVPDFQVTRDTRCKEDKGTQITRIVTTKMKTRQGIWTKKYVLSFTSRKPEKIMKIRDERRVRPKKQSSGHVLNWQKGKNKEPRQPFNNSHKNDEDFQWQDMTHQVRREDFFELPPALLIWGSQSSPFLVTSFKKKPDSSFVSSSHKTWYPRRHISLYSTSEEVLTFSSIGMRDGDEKMVVIHSCFLFSSLLVHVSLSLFPLVLSSGQV